MSTDQTGTSTSTTSSQPWSGVQPYLTQGYQAATNVLNNPIQAYPNSTVVPFSPAMTQALDATQQRASNGSPVNSTANQSLINVMNGPGATSTAQGFLTPYANGSMIGQNPYLDKMYQQAAGQTNAAIQGGMEGAGRYGSGAMANAQASADTNLANQMYGNAYQQGTQQQLTAAQALGSMSNSDQQNQLRSAALAPTAAAADYTDLNALQGVGSAYQGQAQNQLTDVVNRYNQNQQAPTNALNSYITALSGLPSGQTSSTSTPLYSNTAATVAGLGAGGLGMANTLFGNGAGGSSSLWSNLFGSSGLFGG